MREQIVADDGFDELQIGPLDRLRPLHVELLLGGEPHQVPGDDVLDTRDGLGVRRRHDQFEVVSRRCEHARALGEGEGPPAIAGELSRHLVAHVRDELLDVARRAGGGDMCRGDGHR
ncbi:hypothetical protein Pph01_70240 [Planotetraspora phitsanulokensis]|uniref:Uncharacterized protein n=1 Tax=Planotetraspora phitsanulokensis TaxID=575192 RepID=A0A8J3XJH7_9ACTN|nr:hypothetical protein Pph01_70240 [Planotetraspora phitsanulokensis]